VNRNRFSISEILRFDSPRENTLATGWVRAARDGKGFCFVDLNDGSHIKNLQVIVPDTVPGYEAVRNIPTGSSMMIVGDLVDSPAAGQRFELRAKEVTIFGTADPEIYPLQKKRHSFEFLREIAHLRPRTASFGAIFRLRSELSFAIHDFFRSRGFFYVHTPIITASDCEGAGEIFQVTTLDLAHLPLKEGNVDYTQDFFGKRTGLTVSGQLEGELLATALGKVYTFGPTFRAENSNTSRHLSEFWMVEPEIAFAGLDDDMELAEHFLKSIFRHCLEKCPDDMAFFNKRIKPGTIENLEKIVSSEFARITYTEAVDLLLKSGEKFEYPVAWGKDLQSEHERYLTEKKFARPVIVTDYPKEIKAFYMRLNDDEKTVRAMDVLVPGVGEIIGGSEREYRLDVITTRMRDIGLDTDEYRWYLDTRRFGTVPHAGFGLGFERAVQFISGMQNIRDVIPFPRAPRSAEF
jgi:asparaginyl-tRNA synthetase